MNGTKIRLLYPELTPDEKRHLYPKQEPAHHLFWAMYGDERLGYVYQVKRNAAKAWFAEGHTQAWYAISKFGQLCNYADGRDTICFPKRGDAGMAIYRSWSRLTGREA